MRKRPRSGRRAAAAAAMGARTAAAAPRQHCFDDLPQPLALHIFSLVPPDARLRAGLACRAWGELLLSGPNAWRAWTTLNLSDACGVPPSRRAAALAGAAALAAGRLRELDISGIPRGRRDELLDVLPDHADSLRVLSMQGAQADSYIDVSQLRALLACAPALRELRADVSCDAAAARALLRREPPFAAVRIRHLHVSSLAAAVQRHTMLGGGDGASDADDDSDDDDDSSDDGGGGAYGMHAFARDVAAHPSLRALALYGAELGDARAVAALVDAALARGLRRLQLFASRPAPAALPQLARLLAAGGALEALQVQGAPALFAGAAPAEVAAFCDALRRSPSLRTLELRYVGLTPAAARALQLAAAAAAPARARAVLLILPQSC